MVPSAACACQGVPASLLPSLPICNYAVFVSISLRSFTRQHHTRQHSSFLISNPHPTRTGPQIINVDDNTVALAQWGLGTMGEPVEELPDTVVSKRSRHSTAAPFSASKTPGECMQLQRRRRLSVLLTRQGGRQTSVWLHSQTGRCGTGVHCSHTRWC